MSVIQYTKWHTYSDQSLSGMIGAFIRQNRLEQNKTQEELATASGISRSTLSLLEKGETVTLATLIQVLRVLDQLQFMDAFIIQKKISPIAMTKSEKNVRQRARSSKNSNQAKTDW